MSSLPKIVSRHRRDCDLNPGTSAPESSMLTTLQPSHRIVHSVPCKSTPTAAHNKLVFSMLSETIAVR